MGSKGILMRMLPFLATFTLGLFIASFFVTIAAPRLVNRAPGHKFHKMKKLRMENERLRNENLRLRNELESHAANHDGNFGLHQIDREIFLDVPPVPLTPPAAAAPRAAR